MEMAIPRHTFLSMISSSFLNIKIKTPTPIL